MVSYRAIYTREALVKAKELFYIYKGSKIVLGTLRMTKEASVKAFTKYCLETIR